MMSSVSAAQRDVPNPVLALIADRDDDTRRMFGEYLMRTAAFEIEEAADGPTALAKAMARPPDAVVTEERLPGISGSELCRLLRHDAATRATALIVVTADAYRDDLDRARAAGADVVLAKPCRPDVLLAEVRKALERSQELRQRARDLRVRVAVGLARADEIQMPTGVGRRKPLSRVFGRHETTTPPVPPPSLFCPRCDQPLLYQRSHIGGVSERHAEQWDYFDCPSRCGSFQYRQRTRKVRQVY